MKSGVLHLDTHVVCWLYAGALHQFSETARSYLEKNVLGVSPAVVAEMTVLHERGLLRLGALEILDDLEQRVGLRVLAIDALTLVKKSVSLAWASDPFDRLIAAHALHDESSLLTKDALFHAHFPPAVW